MRRSRSLLLAGCLLLATRAAADIIHVPGEYPTIQQGIDAASAGDIVIVAPGTYPEEILLAAGVSVIGAGEGRSIIDGGGDAGDVVRAVGNAITEDTRFAGFTVTGAISGGSLPGGAGLFCNSGAHPDVANCRFEGNDFGLALWNGSNAQVHNNVVVDNTYDGIDLGTGATITNNTIAGNRIGINDGGGYAPVVMNNVITGQSRYGVYAVGTQPRLTYNDVWGNDTNYRNCAPGTGSISADPLYENAGAGDYHLVPGSPGIDSGNPAPEYDDPDGTRNDMGAYGGPGAASNTPMVTTMVPARHDMAAAPGSAVSAGFNLLMDTATVNAATFLVRGLFSGDVAGAVEYDTLASVVTLDPDADFLPGEPVTALLTRDVLSALGDSLGGHAWQFTTAAGDGSGYLEAAATHRANGRLSDIIAVDLNQDRLIDLVTADGTAGTVSTLIGDGTGWFDTSRVSAAGAGAYAVCSGRFDADSALDLAVSCEAGPAVAVLLGNGDGTFQPPAPYPLPSGPRDVCAADFDLDGVLDLAAAMLTRDSIAVFKGNGDGTFEAARVFATGTHPDGICAVDLDNNGHLDLATASSAVDSVSVLLGDGEGGFADHVEHAAGDIQARVAPADFDEDGNADVVAVLPDDGAVRVLFGDGTGGFAGSVRVPTGSDPEDVVCTDFDGDGHLDLAALRSTAACVRMFLGDGSGGFAPLGSFAAGFMPFSLAAADFDSDGDMDVAAADYGDSTVSVLLNIDALAVVTTDPAQYEVAAPETTGVAAVFNMAVVPATLDSSTFIVRGDRTGIHRGPVTWEPGALTGTLTPDADFAPGEVVTATLTTGVEAMTGVPLRGFGWQFTARVPVASAGGFTDFAVYPAGSEPRGACCGDFDSDGDVDLAVTCSDYPNPGSAAVLLNNGNGTFAAPDAYSLNYADPIAIACADLDNDRDLDLVAAHNQPGTSHLSVLKGDGLGNFYFHAGYAPAILGQDLCATDLDADGDLDVVMTDGWGSQDNVRVMFNTGAGSLSGPVTWSAGTWARGVAALDADNDGDFDLVVANSGNDNASVLLNDGRGSFPGLVNYGAGSSPDRPFAGDLDGDGWVDLAFSGSDGIAVILNEGDGTFGPPALYPAGGPTRSIAGGDFDGDGDVDLALAGSGADSLGVVVNDGTGAFGGLVLYPVASYPWGLVTSDLDQDAILDVTCASLDAGGVSVLLAAGTGVAGRDAASRATFDVRPSIVRGKTAIRFALRCPGPVSLKAYDALGRVVDVIFDGIDGPGSSSLEWHPRLARGIYYLRLAAGSGVVTRRVTLVE